MAIIIDIKPEVQEALSRQKAAARGVDIGVYAARLLEQAAHFPAGPKQTLSHRPVPSPKPLSKLEAAYHKADRSIDQIIQLLAA